MEGWPLSSRHSTLEAHPAETGCFRVTCFAHAVLNNAPTQCAWRRGRSPFQIEQVQVCFLLLKAEDEPGESAAWLSCRSLIVALLRMVWAVPRKAAVCMGLCWESLGSPAGHADLRSQLVAALQGSTPNSRLASNAARGRQASSQVQRVPRHACPPVEFAVFDRSDDSAPVHGASAHGVCPAICACRGLGFSYAALCKQVAMGPYMPLQGGDLYACVQAAQVQQL